jgi:NAD(P)-dependent dehydrogenase (short-subunit alcohol dehydrogenase family)
MGLLDGKVALVSGVGPGLGRTIALTLAEEGADVALAARRQDHLQHTAMDIEARGRRTAWLPTDITKPDECARLVNHVRVELGAVHVLVNVAHAGGTNHPFVDTYLTDGNQGEAWRRAMDVNFFGTLNMTHAAVPAMREQGEGRIVMINTMAVRDVQPGQGPYAASKAASAMAVRTLARELGVFGIRVNSVHPGFIKGHAVDAYAERVAAQSGGTPADTYEDLARSTALGYVPDEREIAGTIVFLASDLARPITGKSIDVNCGHWM